MVDLNFAIPRLETDRLVIRLATHNDVEDMFLLRTNKEAMKYINRPEMKTRDDAKVLIDKMNNPDLVAWVITLKTNPAIIGTIGYHRIDTENYRAEIGYMLHPDYWRKGIISEAIKAVIDFGFDKMKLHTIEADINPENDASRKLLIKLGFVKEAYFKENLFFEGKFLDSEIYSLLKN